MLGWYDGDGLGAVVLLVLLVVLLAGAMVALLLVLVRSSTGDPRHEAPHLLPHLLPPPHGPEPVDEVGEVDEGQFVRSHEVHEERDGDPVR